MSRRGAIEAYARELAALYKQHGALDPEIVVEWARAHPESALHGRFEWNDDKAAQQHRLWQARQLITSVEVTYPDGKTRQIYVSPVEQRGAGGYASLVEVMSDKERRAQFLAQALKEYERLEAKYRDLEELAEVHAAVARARRGRKAARTAA